jgi:hypothetical protein
MMESHLSVATIATVTKILRTCRNLRHVIGRDFVSSLGLALRLRRSGLFSSRKEICGLDVGAINPWTVDNFWNAPGD